MSGLVFGVSSLAAPALLAGQDGTARTAFALATTISRATAPLAVAALLHAAGCQRLLVAVAVCCAVAAAGMLLGAGRWLVRSRA